MATYYALPGLVYWRPYGHNGSANAWSNTSGGAPVNYVPTQGDDVVFDANSGPSRTIYVRSGEVYDDAISDYVTEHMQIRNLTFTGNGGITFESENTPSYGEPAILSVSGPSVSLNNCSFNLHVILDAPTSPRTVSLNGQYVQALNINTWVYTTTLLGGVWVGGALYIQGGSGGFYDFSGCTSVTVGSVTVGSNTTNINMGTIIWTINSGNFDFSVNTSGTISGSPTIKFTASGGTQTFNGGGKTYGTVWNATSAGAALQLNGTSTVGTLTLGAGTTTTLLGSCTTTNLVADGSGGKVTLKSYQAGTQRTLTKAGGGVAYLDRCDIKDINFSPSNTFYARSSSVNSGNNTNITFWPDNQKMLNFF